MKKNSHMERIDELENVINNSELKDVKKKAGKRPLALNIGCGLDYRKPDEEYYWINIDADPRIKSDDDISLYRLSRKYNNQIRFIEARDIIEHIPVIHDESRDNYLKVVEDWTKCLVLDGELRIQSPDIHGMYELLCIGEIDEIEYNRRVFDIMSGKFDRHYQMFSKGRLRRILQEFGLRIDHESRLNGNVIVTGRRIK